MTFQPTKSKKNLLNRNSLILTQDKSVSPNKFLNRKNIQITSKDFLPEIKAALTS